jgi:hypothetical protein
MRSSRADQPALRRKWRVASRLLLGRWGAAALAGLCLAMFVGGVLGVVSGAAAAAAAGRALGRLETGAARARRERLAAELPAALDLLAACLAAGRPPPEALAAVASALDGPVADELALVSTRLSLGADPASVWSAVAAHPVMGPLGRTMARSSSNRVHRLLTAWRGWSRTSDAPDAGMRSEGRAAWESGLLPHWRCASCRLSSSWASSRRSPARLVSLSADGPVMIPSHAV